jgi:carbon monoxide dehydrogenase subunit G
MSSTTRSVRVDAAPGAVWALLADFGGLAAWVDAVDHSCLLSHRTEGVGTVRRVQSGRIVLVEEVTVWEPGERLAYAITGLPSRLGSVTNTWRLEPDGSGTRVALTTHVDAGGLPHQRLIARVVARRSANASDAMLAGLARQELT